MVFKEAPGNTVFFGSYELSKQVRAGGRAGGRAGLSALSFSFVVGCVCWVGGLSLLPVFLFVCLFVVWCYFGMCVVWWFLLDL